MLPSLLFCISSTCVPVKWMKADFKGDIWAISLKKNLTYQSVNTFLGSCFHLGNFATLILFKIKFVLWFVTILSKIISL